MLDGNSRTAKRRRAVTDDLVKRLNMVDATMHPMTLVIIAREALEYIENMESMIEWMENMDPKLVDEARMVLWRDKDG